MSNYEKEQLETLNELLSKAPLVKSITNIYGGSPTSIKYNFDSISDEEDGLYVNYKANNSLYKFRLRKLLKELGKDYKCKNNALYKMRDSIEKSDKKFGPALREFLENYLFITDDSTPIENEIEWLEKHVTKIRARIPLKMVNAFKRQFPGQLYEARDGQWAFGFTLFVDETNDIPQSLLNIKNKNGNSFNLERKSFDNTSYIARLVKYYPDKFHFGATR